MWIRLEERISSNPTAKETSRGFQGLGLAKDVELAVQGSENHDFGPSFGNMPSQEQLYLVAQNRNGQPILNE